MYFRVKSVVVSALPRDSWRSWSRYGAVNIPSAITRSPGKGGNQPSPVSPVSVRAPHGICGICRRCTAAAATPTTSTTISQGNPHPKRPWNRSLSPHPPPAPPPAMPSRQAAAPPPSSRCQSTHAPARAHGSPRPRTAGLGSPEGKEKRKTGREKSRALHCRQHQCITTNWRSRPLALSNLQMVFIKQNRWFSFDPFCLH